MKNKLLIINDTSEIGNSLRDNCSFFDYPIMTTRRALLTFSFPPFFFKFHTVQKF